MSNTDITAIVQSNTTPIVAQIVSSGTKGETGDSAYQIWLDAGNTGTEEEFLISLKGAENYIHDQTVSSNTWTINHNLNKYPSVTIVDSSGHLVFGDINYTSISQVIVSFSATFSGKAYLN